ncbi:MAG: hypothetical protein IKH46_01120 [Lachnospiraceae bacterium]|nr:hypothetical protein [Lachnospiraceae bacterium]
MCKRMVRKIRKNMRYRWFRSLIMQWCITGIVLMIGSIILLNAVFPEKVNAGESGEVYYKYFRNITIEKGDTLWEYAEMYKSPEISTKEYIREVEFINQLEDSRLQTGKTITIPYYSTEYVCTNG